MKLESKGYNIKNKMSQDIEIALLTFVNEIIISKSDGIKGNQRNQRQ